MAFTEGIGDVAVLAYIETTKGVTLVFFLSCIEPNLDTKQYFAAALNPYSYLLIIFGEATEKMKVADNLNLTISALIK